MFSFITIIIVAFVNAVFLWFTMTIFARHESDREWPKLVWISFATLCVAGIFSWLIDDWAAFLSMPFLAWSLYRWCSCSRNIALKITAIYTLITVAITLAFSLLSHDDDEYWEIEGDNGETYKVKVNGLPKSIRDAKGN